MKSQFEQTDIDAIVDALVAKLSTDPGVILATGSKAGVDADEDRLFDVEELAAYLRVDRSWVYRQVQAKAVPLTYVGRYPRFVKSQIDAWLKANSVPPVTAPSSKGRLRDAA